MHAQLIPTTLCEEAAIAFADLLKGRAGGGLNDEHFSRDWSPLWDELVRDGWTVIADRPDAEFSLLDLTAFARAWGSYLVPLPFLPTLAVRRGLDTPPEPDARLSYAVAEQGTTLVPYGPTARVVLTADGLTGPDALPTAAGIDDWAASAPTTLLPAGTGPASAAMRRDGAILSAAEAVGAAAAVLRRSVEYAKVREQFGQPIGRFQAIKHRLANMHCSVELAASALAWACFEPDDAARALTLALGHCLQVAEGAVQVHGGIGYTWEASPHRYYRHIMSMRRIVAAAVGQA
ncbi:MAG TPA: acyl-CoA dehydrogenase family protein [Streptosporangiaceae bacterium]|nr:acyl-CoA dehydrogenase family protein [Streptosporangiaceae bacterium]